jgi:hypothetical protein
MTALTVPTPTASRSTHPTDASPLARFFGVVARPQSYRNLRSHRAGRPGSGRRRAVLRPVRR